MDYYISDCVCVCVCVCVGGGGGGGVLNWHAVPNKKFPTKKVYFNTVFFSIGDATTISIHQE